MQITISSAIMELASSSSSTCILKYLYFHYHHRHCHHHHHHPHCHHDLDNGYRHRVHHHLCDHRHHLIHHFKYHQYIAKVNTCSYGLHSLSYLVPKCWNALVHVVHALFNFQVTDLRHVSLDDPLSYM